MLNSALILAAAEEGHVVHELPIPPLWFGIIAFLVFLLLLLAVLSIRSVGLRHEPHTAAVQPRGGHGSHGAGHGTHGSHGAGH